MKKFDLKSIVCGILIGVLGVTTVIASNGIKSAEFKDYKFIFNGTEIALSQPIISVIKEGAYDEVNYIPMRDVADIMGLDLGININSNSIILNGNVNSNPKLKENITNQKSNLLNTSESKSKRLEFYIEDKGKYTRNSDWSAYITNEEVYINYRALFINFDNILPDLKKYNLHFESWEPLVEHNIIMTISDSKKTETLNGHIFDDATYVSLSELKEKFGIIIEFEIVPLSSIGGKGDDDCMVITGIK